MTEAPPTQPTTTTTATTVEPVAPPQMAPRWRRAVLLTLWVVFALWVAGLLWMYFHEVYPRRHPPAEKTPASSVR